MPTEERIDMHSRKIASLEAISLNHDKDIRKLRDNHHEMSTTLAVQNGMLRSIGKSLEGIDTRLEHNQDKDEAVIERIYERLKTLDDELKVSFSARDKQINDLDKKVVRVVAYATSALFVFSILLRVFL